MRTDDLAHKIGPTIHRFQPRSLQGRLALAAVCCSLLGVWSTYAFVHQILQREFTALARQAAADHLQAFEAFLGNEREGVAALSSSIAGGIEARGVARTLEGTTGPAWLGRALAIGRGSTVAIVDASGRTVFATGSPVETRELSSLASLATTGPVSGLVWADRVLVVAVHEVGSQGEAAGHVIVARPLTPDVRSRFVSLDRVTEVLLHAPAAAPVSELRASGVGNVSTSASADGSSRTSAVLTGLDGENAAGLEIAVRDMQLGSAMDSASEAAFGTALLVSVLGTGVGLALARTIRAPIERTRAHLRNERQRALNGLSCEPVEMRPETTTEFAGLAHEVDSLLSALSLRQNELVMATDQATRAEASLRSVLDDSPECKLLVESGRIVLANRAAEQLLGLPVTQLVGMTSAEVIDGAKARYEDGGRVTVENIHDLEAPVLVCFSPEEGVERWAELTMVPHLPNPSRVLVSARDVTEQRRLQALREEIFSLVSHDLRAPLTVVQGYLDILERPLQPEARARALESARHNASKMADLLEDLLDATAPEDLLTPKIVVPVSLSAVAKDVVSSMRAAADGHSIVLVADEDATVAGEERRLRQALVNLVSNAIKYSPQDTTVTVRVRRDDAHGVLAVEDEGPGIPEDARDTVFTRYGRLATTARKPGIGLGLYIVRIIAEKHGGTVRVEDAPGGGARFVIELPLSAEEA